jgi:hypothetical protein
LISRRHDNQLLIKRLYKVCMTRASASSQTFYVSPRGNDAWIGMVPDMQATDGPFRTLYRAHDDVRHALAHDPAPSLSILLRSGDYYLDEPFMLDDHDGGRKGVEVVYRNYPGLGFVDLNMAEAGLRADFPFADPVDPLDRLYIVGLSTTTALRLMLGASAPLRLIEWTTTGFVADVSRATLHWRSAAPQIVAVDRLGNVTAIAPRTARIIAKAVLHQFVRQVWIYVVVDNLKVSAHSQIAQRMP